MRSDDDPFLLCGRPDRCRFQQFDCCVRLIVVPIKAFIVASMEAKSMVESWIEVDSMEADYVEASSLMETLSLMDASSKEVA